MNVYLDNAATTPLDPEVFESMKPFLLEDFGNPSSTHVHGRKAKTAIESARKQIASLLNCTPGEIIFTSGGTEADNTILYSGVQTYGIKNIISSPLEHHAVEHTLANIVAQNVKIKLHLVNLSSRGYVDHSHLETLLKENSNVLVSLMHANNEIGNILDINTVGEMCERYDAYFHSDTVQSIGHYKLDLKKIKVHAITAAAHKFHGPKGVGFMFIRKEKKLNPFIQGGAQERSMRGGTENVSGIVGMAKALEIAYRDMDKHLQYLKSLKLTMIEKLKDKIPDVRFNGDSENIDDSLYTVLNVSLPAAKEDRMILFNLDLKGISASGGSACASGALSGSHVLNALYPESKRDAVRFSFSKFNTAEEIDFAVNQLALIIN